MWVLFERIWDYDSEDDVLGIFETAEMAKQALVTKRPDATDWILDRGREWRCAALHAKNAKKQDVYFIVEYQLNTLRAD